MNPLILPIVVAIAKSLGWAGITNSYIVIGMLSISSFMATFLIVYEIKYIKNIGKI